jgi:hypothetical protein
MRKTVVENEDLSNLPGPQKIRRQDKVGWFRGGKNMEDLT